jgi:homoserine acetyltransferase
MLEYLEIGDLVLENGTIIRNVKIAYNVYGNIENAENNLDLPCTYSQF